MKKEFLIDLIKKAVSPFQCVEAAVGYLKKVGFEELCYEKKWNLRVGGKYLLNHHGTTLFAFSVGSSYHKGDMLRMAAAHTDYPCLRIKPNADFQTEGYAQVNVEVYGGPILNTWFDRPLGVAGRVALRSDNPFEPRMVLYRSPKPVLIIPNLAIHMNREVNKGVEINNQIDLMPIADMLPKEKQSTDYFLTFLAEELGVDKKDILDFELNTFCVEEPVYVGVKDTMISSPRLDNQTSVAALLAAITEVERADGINLIALFDHEEIGNTSKQGAASILLHDMARRILRGIGLTEEEIDCELYDAMLLSVDVAHALHPNHKGKMDITNHPVLGQGFCIKQACSQSYATDAEAIAILCQICDEKGIVYQRFVNRSDVRGGGTLGAVASALLPVKTVDIGIPLLAMHSARELMGVEDMDALFDAVCAYFS
ncbi:MAG: M18 family aminopeptidase [Lachnospiraceae bacterium]|nr:M18 family aminopeptidase [Agathobacter sp.]MDD6291182.1 M18 family aminopeptidase [Lachnospiraceae bacterium]